MGISKNVWDTWNALPWLTVQSSLFHPFSTSCTQSPVLVQGTPNTLVILSYSLHSWTTQDILHNCSSWRTPKWSRISKDRSFIAFAFWPWLSRYASIIWNSTSKCKAVDRWILTLIVRGNCNMWSIASVLFVIGFEVGAFRWAILLSVLVGRS